MNDLKDVESILSLEDVNQNLCKLDWSEDGQLLALSTVTGGIHVFLMKLPLLASVNAHRIAFMTSLKEISIYDHLSKTKVFIESFRILNLLVELNLLFIDRSIKSFNSY